MVFVCARLIFEWFHMFSHGFFSVHLLFVFILFAAVVVLVSLVFNCVLIVFLCVCVLRLWVSLCVLFVFVVLFIVMLNVLNCV